MANDLRLQFDVAFALAVMKSGTNVRFPLPERLVVDGTLQQIIDEVVANGSFAEATCTLRDDVATKDTYHIDIGDARLSLCPKGRIHAGGSGIAIQLIDQQLQRSYALKVPRISVLAYQYPDYDVLLADAALLDRVSAEVNAFKNEREISRQLSHQNIVRYFYGETRFIRDLMPGVHADFPLSVSEWIDGARPLHKYLLAEKPALRTIISLISDTLSALEHVHQQGVIHWDLKSDNILIGGNHVAKLIDFGNAKLPHISRKNDRLVTSTKGKYPRIRVFKEVDAEFGESNRFQITLPNKSWNHRFIDLWMLGQEWNRCLALSREFITGESDLNADEQRCVAGLIRNFDTSPSRDAPECLRIIFDRLLFPFDPYYVDEFIGADESFVSDKLYYQSAAEILEELARIAPPFGAAQDVPELLVSLDEIVRLPVTGNSVFTARVAALIDSSLVAPTTLHYQLAQVRQVFPGATHSRFEHLLGTLTTATYFVRSLYLNELNAFWRVSVRSEDIRSVLLAAILHDTGHLAFGHFIEEMDDLLFELKHDNYIVCLLERCLQHLTGDRKPDQPRTKPAFTISETEVADLIAILEKHWCDDVARDARPTGVLQLLTRVIAIFDPDRGALTGSYYLRRDGTRQAIDNVLKSIIDGPIDADKLDYLRRDAFHAGVSYANGIDLERFFESLRVCVQTGAKKTAGTVLAPPAIGVSEKGVAPTETIITARYHMYTTVYWHRTVRSITAMLQRVISEVRLAVADAEWTSFLSELLKEFRRLDDRQSLEWLKKKLQKMKLFERALRSPDDADKHRGGVKIGDIVDALLGDRAKYYRMAFELQYDGRTDVKEGKRAAEVLHDKICEDVHPTVPYAQAERSAHGTAERARRARFTQELEDEFSRAVTDRIPSSKFSLNTILVDVPEPGKDQIRGLLVDKRSKRSAKRLLRGTTGTAEDFVDLADISPIASAMGDVFKRWARKVRVYMTPADIDKLAKLGIELGDVGSIWEKVFYDRYGVDPGQLMMALPGEPRKPK